MKEDDYKKILKYIVDKLNCQLPTKPYVLVESPLVFIVNTYREFDIDGHSIGIKCCFVGSNHANGIGSNTYREYFEILRKLCKISTFKPQSLVTLMTRPIHELLIAAELENQY